MTLEVENPVTLEDILAKNRSYVSLMKRYKINQMCHMMDNLNEPSFDVKSRTRMASTLLCWEYMFNENEYTRFNSKYLLEILRDDVETMVETYKILSTRLEWSAVSFVAQQDKELSINWLQHLNVLEKVQNTEEGRLIFKGAYPWGELPLWEEWN